MAKQKTVFFCKNCGAESPKWVGKCPNCGEWNTFIEEPVGPKSKSPFGSTEFSGRKSNVAEIGRAHV